MSTIVLVRHGQTELSRASHFCGTTEVPLAEAGLEMAEDVAGRAARGRCVGRVGSSPRRAGRTARPRPAEA